ncbi:MAG: glutamate--tRNA ligase [Candidatus Cloacimonetes bacterium]|nr:glutamate--tRNA ligase [Candidatus Cloacimonadota bacterium]
MTVRTRFAPSPTGYVHVGSVRTALYCYLFARHHGGQYLLRIEDTDQTRYVEGAVENLLGVMKTLGIVHDEGPDCGGNKGPYYQSQRLDIYQEKIKILLEKNHAYPCFCTAKRLELMREEQTLLGLPPKYDGHCKTLSPEEVSEKMATEAYVIRLRVPDSGQVVVDDLIRGKVGFQNNTVDDQVLMKSDGFPTYHFANVVDDHEMEITHVIRGEEWLSSTPKHLLLYQFFGWEPPKFAHLPLLLNPDKSKLSKRQGDVAVEDFLKAGYFEEALLNFLALLGWHPSDNREIFSVAELIQEFSLDRVSKSGAVFDREKLDWMNGQYLKSQISWDRYLALVLPHIPKEVLDSLGEAKLHKVLMAVRPNLDKPQDILVHLPIFTTAPQEFDLGSEEVLEILKIDTNTQLFLALRDLLAKSSNELGMEEFKEHLKTIQKEHKIKGKALFMPVRVALSGVVHGPDLAQFAEIMGRQEMIDRLNLMLERLG